MAIDPADYLAPPRLLNRDDKLATLSIKVNEADPHLKIIDQQVCLKLHREALHRNLSGRELPGRG